MGNSGFRKLFFQGCNVETSYQSFYDMSVVNIEKKEESLSPLRGSYTIVVNSSSHSQEDTEHLQRLKQLMDSLKNQQRITLLVFPCNSFYNEGHNYQQILSIYRGLLGEDTNIKIMQKVEINGKYTHPVYRFLKRNCKDLYDEELSQGKRIREDFCKFLVDPNGRPISYYNRKQDISLISKDIECKK